jgi:hypothetical protein
LENAILLEKDSTSGRRSEISIVEAWNIPVGRQSSILVASTIICAEDSIMSRQGEFSNFLSEYAIHKGNISAPGWRINSTVGSNPTSWSGYVVNI